MRCVSLLGRTGHRRLHRSVLLAISNILVVRPRCSCLPLSSMTCACNPALLYAYSPHRESASAPFKWQFSSDMRFIMCMVIRLTPCTRALLPPSFTLVSAPPLTLASDLCLLTNCVVPNVSDAGRFSPDMLGACVWFVNQKIDRTRSVLGSVRQTLLSRGCSRRVKLLLV